MKKPLLSFVVAAVAGLVLLGGTGVQQAAAVSAPPQPVAHQHAFLAADDAFVPNFIGDWPPEAKAAWDKVANALAAHIGVSVPINIDIEWKPLDGGFLGMG